MAQIKGKFIQDNAVDASKIKLANNQYLKGRNAANNADVDIIKVTSGDELECPVVLNIQPPTSSTHASTKAYVDTEITTLSATVSTNSSDISALQGDVSTLQGDVSTLQGDVSTLQSDMINAQSDISSLQSNKADISYVDAEIEAAVSNLDGKQSVRVASTANIDLATGGLLTIDGVTLISGDRVLVKNQSTASQNGIYVAAAGAWARSADADVSAEVTPLMTVGIEEGTANGAKVYWLTTTGTIVLGTTNLVFSLLGPQVVSPAPVWNKEALVLSGGDITNQYKDLAFEAAAYTLDLVVAGVYQEQGQDYSLALNLGVTRITFLNDLATGGGAALIAGDKLVVKYQKA